MRVLSAIKRKKKMSTSGDFGNPLRKFKLVFLGEQSGNVSDDKIFNKD